MSDITFTCISFGETNQGMVRTNNEDSYICQKIWDNNHVLCAAIDGLGGYEGGEVAAEIARTTIIKHLEEFASKKTGDLLKDALIEANNEIINQHKARPKVAQMGCVASVGLIDLSQGTLTIAHVGDSRIYQFSNGILKKLTHDHSLVGYREEIGEMTEEDAMNHPKRNVIDKFLGEQHLALDNSDYVEISVWPILDDTQFLFCSDGLTDLVTSAQIKEVLSADLSIKAKTQRLIACANKAGGKDNITVVIADVSAKTNPVKNISDSQNQNKQVLKQTAHSGKSAPKKHSFVHGLIIGILIGMACMYAFSLVVRIAKHDIPKEKAKHENVRNLQKSKLSPDSISPTPHEIEHSTQKQQQNQDTKSHK